MNTLSNGFRSDQTNWKPPIRLMLITDSLLDCEALRLLFLHRARFHVLEATSDFHYGMARCKRLVPDILLLSGSVGYKAIEQAANLVAKEEIKHLLLLDDRTRECALNHAMRNPRVSYYTRRSGIDDLLCGMLEIVDQGQRLFDPQVADRIRRTTKGFRLDQQHDRPSVALLTEREQQVMRLLANKGNSVSDCAQKLELAVSTIDNHKSRMMRKLQVHKAAELTCLAIRDGLIRV